MTHLVSHFLFEPLSCEPFSVYSVKGSLHWQDRMIKALDRTLVCVQTLSIILNRIFHLVHVIPLVTIFIRKKYIWCHAPAEGGLLRHARMQELTHTRSNRNAITVSPPTWCREDLLRSVLCCWMLTLLFTYWRTHSGNWIPHYSDIRLNLRARVLNNIHYSYMLYSLLKAKIDKTISLKLRILRISIIDGTNNNVIYSHWDNNNNSIVSCIHPRSR